jgi:ferredoxin-NADP reductase/Na+-translocating ferredoxin:NAD+ oxidoreductase RnfD subunit
MMKAVYSAHKLNMSPLNAANVWLNKIFKPIDRQLDRLTSYKLVLYILYVILGWSVVASVLHQVTFKWYWILVSAAWLVAICVGANMLLSRYLDIPKNKESELITALILVLIISPAKDLSDFAILAFAGLIAMASKYILVINRWHLFNPAAFGVFAIGLLFNHYASWWVGTDFMTPVIFLCGMLILRKMKRFIMAIIFELTVLVLVGTQAYLNQSASQAWHNVWSTLISSGLLFFAYVMLTEPLTSPRHLRNYVPYALLVGLLYSYINFGLEPEQALLLGNIFAYVIEPNRRMQLKFVQKIEEASGIESYIFSGKNNFKYKAGQYMEWTIDQNNSDSRGNRRYLTLASSPTEKELMFTLREPENASSFKRKLHNFKRGDKILAAQLSGNFTLPVSEKTKLAFLAGGVGITPFRSMIKYMVDFEQQRDIQLIYAAKSKNEFAFTDLFKKAQNFGLESTYIEGALDKAALEQAVPDLRERTFYVSGPYGFVNASEEILTSLHVPAGQIITDYFPGYGN